ncbi:MAG: hypothetical protein ACFFB5_13375 [Promethearchaeota archaeon]
MINVELSIFQIISIGIFGFIFGLFEMMTNGLYLLTKNYELPKKQHGKELPADASTSEIKHKVIQMMILGIFLVIIAIIATVISPQLFVVGATAILVSGLIDYGKYRKKDMFIVWIGLASICGLFSLIHTV